jgi:hypothetical protein
MTREETINELAFSILKDIAMTLSSDTNYETIKAIANIIVVKMNQIKDFNNDELMLLSNKINLD